MWCRHHSQPPVQFLSRACWWSSSSSPVQGLFHPHVWDPTATELAASFHSVAIDGYQRTSLGNFRTLVAYYERDLLGLELVHSSHPRHTRWNFNFSIKCFNQSKCLLKGGRATAHNFTQSCLLLITVVFFFFICWIFCFLGLFARNRKHSLTMYKYGEHRFYSTVAYLKPTSVMHRAMVEIGRLEAGRKEEKKRDRRLVYDWKQKKKRKISLFKIISIVSETAKTSCKFIFAQSSPLKLIVCDAILWVIKAYLERSCAICAVRPDYT